MNLPEKTIKNKNWHDAVSAILRASGGLGRIATDEVNVGGITDEDVKNINSMVSEYIEPFPNPGSATSLDEIRAFMQRRVAPLLGQGLLDPTGKKRTFDESWNNIMTSLKPRKVNIPWDITRKLDWENMEFRGESSCWWTSGRHRYARWTLLHGSEFGQGFAFRIFTHSDEADIVRAMRRSRDIESKWYDVYEGRGRVWVGAHPNGLIAFNQHDTLNILRGSLSKGVYTMNRGSFSNLLLSIINNNLLEGQDKYRMRKVAMSGANGNSNYYVDSSQGYVIYRGRLDEGTHNAPATTVYTSNWKSPISGKAYDECWTKLCKDGRVIHQDDTDPDTNDEHEMTVRVKGSSVSIRNNFSKLWYENGEFSIEIGVGY